MGDGPFFDAGHEILALLAGQLGWPWGTKWKSCHKRPDEKLDLDVPLLEIQDGIPINSWSVPMRSDTETVEDCSDPGSLMISTPRSAGR